MNPVDEHITSVNMIPQIFRPAEECKYIYTVSKIDEVSTQICVFTKNNVIAIIYVFHYTSNEYDFILYYKYF